MAKKADLLEEAKELGLSVTEKNTIAEIEAAISSADKKSDVQEDKDVVTEREAETAKAGKRSEKSQKEAEEKASEQKIR